MLFNYYDYDDNDDDDNDNDDYNNDDIPRPCLTLLPPLKSVEASCSGKASR